MQKGQLQIQFRDTSNTIGVWEVGQGTVDNLSIGWNDLICDMSSPYLKLPMPMFTFHPNAINRIQFVQSPIATQIDSGDFIIGSVYIAGTDPDYRNGFVGIKTITGTISEVLTSMKNLGIERSSQINYYSDNGTNAKAIVSLST